MTFRIRSIRAHDIRYPTSDRMKGSDPFHRKPDYSCAYVEVHTSDPQLTGRALVFTIGAGTDWIVRGIGDLAVLFEGVAAQPLLDDLGTVHRRLIDHHQLRWLGDAGVYSMAVGGLMNAFWDLAAKVREEPMWRYLIGLSPESIVGAVNWRHLRDALTREEALGILRRVQDREQRIAALERTGPEAYSTAAWSGLTDDEVVRACLHAVNEQGMRSVKAKVGLDLDADRKRLRLMRDTVGPDVGIRVDANQIWGVAEAIDWMRALADIGIVWIEEPTHPDDVFGYKTIRDALRDYGIGVAGGEHTKNPILFKQLLRYGAIDYCQIDATRMSGPSDVLGVILLAQKYGVPVCPHGGGIGLCNLIQHYGAWDQAAVAATGENRVVEWIDFLGEAMVEPVRVRNGHYVLPSTPGWGAELRPEFAAQYSYPAGPFWRDRAAELQGVRFEA